MPDETITSVKPHISLNVKNVTESVEFYAKLFGIEPIKFIQGNTPHILLAAPTQ